MWPIVINFIVSFVINELLRPKPNVQKPPAASLNDFNFPTATADRAIPVVWGTVRLFPNTTWHGDYAAIPVEHEVQTGFFSSMTVTDGYQYHVGMTLVLCHDSIDELIQVTANDEHGLLSAPIPVIQPFNFRTEFALAGIWNSSAGQVVSDGVNATCELHCRDRTPSAYLQAVQGVQNTSAHPHLTYVVFQGASRLSDAATRSVFGFPLLRQIRSGFVGSSPNLPSLGFLLKRLPKLDALDVVSDFNIGTEKRARLAAANEIDGDANPATALLELLTNPIWGLDMPVALIDLDSVLSAAETLKAEGNGFSYSWETTRPAAEIQKIIEKQINGTLEKDLSTGRFRVRLIRETDQSVLTLDESNITSLASFVRTGVDERANEVHAQFFDKTALYRTTDVIVQDVGAIRQANAIIPINVAYEGVTNQNLASNLGLRDLRALSSPLARISLKANVPYGQILLPGDVVTFNWPRLGVFGLRCRVASVRYGISGNAQFELLQDVFTDASQFYTTPIPPTTTTPVEPTAMVSQHALLLAPYALTGDEADTALYYAIQPAPRSAATYYNASFCEGTTFDLDNLYELQKNRVGFAVQGTLNAALSSTAQPSSLALTVPSECASALASGTYSSVFGIVGGEWIRVDRVLVTDQTATLTGLQRGIFDTVPGVHAAGDSLVLLLDYVLDAGRMQTEIHASNNYSHLVADYPGHAALSVSSLASSPAGWGLVFGTPRVLLAGNSLRAALPYGPGSVRINGVYGAAESELVYPNCGGNAFPITWAPRNRLNRGLSSWFTGDGSSEPNTQLRVVLEQYANGTWQQFYSTEGQYDGSGNSVLVDPSQYSVTKPATLRLTLTPKRLFGNGDYVYGAPQTWCWAWN